MPETTAGVDSDLALLRQIGQGDTQAFSVFMHRHLDRIVAFVQRTTGARDVAEDIAQEVFLKVWQHAGRWQERGASVSTWLHQIALNRCRDRWRRQGVELLELDDTWESTEPGPEQRLLIADQAARVRAALDLLPPRQRVAIVLAHFQGLSQSEAATVLNTSVDALESLLARARRRLKTLLLEPPPPPPDPIA